MLFLWHAAVSTSQALPKTQENNPCSSSADIPRKSLKASDIRNADWWIN